MSVARRDPEDTIVISNKKLGMIAALVGIVMPIVTSSLTNYAARSVSEAEQRVVVNQIKLDIAKIQARQEAQEELNRTFLTNFGSINGKLDVLIGYRF